MKSLLTQGVKLNLKDNLARYVFYMDGKWSLGTRLPTPLDFKEFYVIEHGCSHAIVL